MSRAAIHDNEIIRHSNAVAAGTTDVEPANGIDSANCDGILFLAAFGSITAGAATTVKAQQSSVVDGSGDDFSDIAGTSVTVADDDDNQIVALEIKRPTKRYVRCVVTRATQNSAVDGIIAIRQGANKRPVTQGATVAGAELHEDKAEGTA